MITVKTASIKAASTIAATKDVRDYLIGVQILVRDDGSVHVRSTNGVMVFDDLMPEKSAFAPADFIIPLDSAKLIAKSKTSTVEIIMSADGRYECAGQIFEPIDGRFPDCDRVLPARDSKFDGLTGDYDFTQLAVCQNAMRIATENSSGQYRIQNSPTALMYREEATYPRVAVMPLRPAAFADN